jgi:hypothetical protein
MPVLAVLFGSLLLYRIEPLVQPACCCFASWIVSARFALATMFVFTAVPHFSPMKRDRIAMVPTWLGRIFWCFLRAGWNSQGPWACSSRPHAFGQHGV